jgi:hypothetical protein
MDGIEELPLPESEQDPTSRSLLRLVVGGVLESSSILLREVRDWEASHPSSQVVVDGSEVDPYSLDAAQLRHAAIGLLFRTAQTAFQGAAVVAYGAGSLTRKILSPFKPVLNNPLTRSTGSRYNSLVSRGEQEIGGMVRLGQIEEQRSRQMAQDIFNGVVGQVIQNLSDNPQITVLIQTQVNELARSDEDIPQFDELVSKLAGNYLAYLQEHPEELSGLVRQAGDNYIDYLNENPEQVQDLIQGQSLTLTAEILDEVRERTVTIDSFLEMVARALFRRSPRAELPGPPPQVRARAEIYRLTRDIKPLEGSNDGR